MMEAIGSPLSAGSDPCIVHNELDEVHKTPTLIYELSTQPEPGHFHMICRPIDSFCEAFETTGDVSQIETEVDPANNVLESRPTGV